MVANIVEINHNIQVKKLEKEEFFSNAHRSAPLIK